MRKIVPLLLLVFCTQASSLPVVVTGSPPGIDQNDIAARTDAGSGSYSGITVTDLTEETAPAAGDFLFGWRSEGDVRKFDIGDLPDGDGLTQASCTANGNTTGVAGNHYVCDISGYSANRDITFPACSVGDQIAVTLETGDDTYEAVVKGAATVSINGGSAATEWSTLFLDNESIGAECVASNAWVITRDERKALSFTAESSADEPMTPETFEKVPVDTITTAQTNMPSSWFDGVTNYRLTPGRPGKWLVKGYVKYQAVADGERSFVHLYLNGAVSTCQNWEGSGSALATSIRTCMSILTLNGTTDYLELWGRHDDTTLSRNARIGSGFTVTWLGE